MSPENVETRRVVMAGLAMQGLLVGNRVWQSGCSAEEIATEAVRYADALLAELAEEAK